MYFNVPSAFVFLWQDSISPASVLSQLHVPTPRTLDTLQTLKHGWVGCGGLGRRCRLEEGLKFGCRDEEMGAESVGGGREGWRQVGCTEPLSGEESVQADITS